MLYANFKRVIAIGVVVFIISFIGSLSASAYSDSYLNDNLPSGISSAVSWDDTCRLHLSKNINFGNFPNLRAAINYGAAYQTVTWISSESRGNTISPIKVNYGDTRIRLRLNMIVFLCGTMVQPQYDSVCGAVWLGGYQLLADHQRWVLSPSHGNDRPPNNRVGCMYPAMTYDYRKLYNMKVSSNDFTNVSLASSDALNGKTVLSMKNPYTRYWFSNPVYFDVIVPGGIKNSGTVRINGLYRQINGYHHAYPAYGNSYCLTQGPTQYAQDVWQIDNCPAFDIDYSISVEMIEHYNLTPTLSVSQKTIDAGENKIAGINASFGHDGSTTKTKNNDKYYTVVKYKVPKGQNLVLPAREGIVTWSGNWPCEAIKKINGSVDCQGDLVKTKHTGELQLNQSVTMLNNHTDDVLSSNLQLGDKICYVAMVSAYNQNADYHTFKTSQAQCVTVGKTPKVQVWGGDVKTEKDVKTSKSVIKDVVSSVTEKDIKKAVTQSSKHWIFGKGVHIDFQGETVVSAKAKDDVSPNIEGNEGTTVATDRLGNVKFFTDGKNIYDKNGNIKVSGLNAHATTTQAAAVFPIKNNRYVIVTSSAASENYKLGKLEYTVVDVSGGGVTVVGLKNQQFGNKSGEVIGESLTIARNQDDTGYWVVVNFPGTNRMGAIAVPYEWDGNNGKAFSYVESSLGGVAGTASGGGYAPGFGSINFNNDQNKAVIAANADSKDRTIVKAMSFDRLSGRFTNVLAEWKIYRRDDQNEKGMMYSADFSPKDNYIYVSTLHTAGKGGHAIAGMVYRYKLHSGAPMEIVSSTKKDPLPYYTDNPSEACQETWGSSSGGQIKSAPDGKMYVANKNYKYIGVIEYPDATDIKKIGWKPKGLELKGRCNSYGLPQMAAISKQLIPPSITTKTTSYGSWAEYGVIAKGSVSSASGAGLSSSYGGRSITNESLYNKLTFANTPKFGQFSPTLTADTYAAPKTGIDRGGLFGSVNVDALQSGNYRAGNLTISGGTLAVGRNVVIESTGTVTISGNVNYATTNDSSKLPQLVIKAKNIVIQPNVTEINAWLITDKVGYVSTCGAVANTTAWLSGINPNDCDKLLKVNGPIKAGRLFLRRTYGAQHATAAKNDPNMHPGTPAEILNLRADTYMWAYNLGRNDGAIKTAHLKEMAPRY